MKHLFIPYSRKEIYFYGNLVSQDTLILKASKVYYREVVENSSAFSLEKKMASFSSSGENPDIPISIRKPNSTKFPTLLLTIHYAQYLLETIQ